MVTGIRLEELLKRPQLNYEVLLHMYYARKDHKLTEWHVLCDWMRGLPYFAEVCLQEDGSCV